MTAFYNKPNELSNNLFIKKMSEKLISNDEIPADLYTE